MLIINEEDISRLADPLELTDVMVKAMNAYEQGAFTMPDRVHMDFGNNTLLLMPVSYGQSFCTKLVSLFPDNPKRNEPVLYGTVILNDGENGKPLALFNGAKLTAVRTAAVGSAGIRYTSPENCTRLGLVGAGVQGMHQILFACKNRPIRDVIILDTYTERLESFVTSIIPLLPEVNFSIASNAVELCEKSEIIITATNALSPVLPNDPELLSGKHIIAIGSYKPEMIELPDALFPLLKKVYIDVDMALEESGDLIHSINSGLIKNDQVALLSTRFQEKELDKRNETSLYKSVGMALFDLFTADYLFQKAIQSGVGTKIEF